ncbi:rRNA maturation RNase YbeY [Candidatus Dojkabacteria bacterium]|nr:rRNA maturation RNase YbeY [Candidatus Dojkabacteria bacterium]
MSASKYLLPDIFVFKSLDSVLSNLAFDHISKYVLSLKKSFKSVPFFAKSFDKDGYFDLEENDINIVITDGYLMKGLNNRFRNINNSTDVLSFPMHENGVLGEVWICPSNIKYNAGLNKETFEIELLRVVVHGMLHLYGYDHASYFSRQKKEKEEMFKIQEKVLDNLFIK